jgi:hypothetical protein
VALRIVHARDVVLCGETRLSIAVAKRVYLQLLSRLAGQREVVLIGGMSGLETGRWWGDAALPSAINYIRSQREDQQQKQQSLQEQEQHSKALVIDAK